METKSHQKTVIFDGECPVCITLKNFSTERDNDHELAFVAFQDEDFEQAAPHLSKGEARQALYVLSTNGERIRGARAVFEIMSALPGGLNIIGRIMKQPPLYWIAEPFYRLFARHRHRVSKLLRHCPFIASAFKHRSDGQCSRFVRLEPGKIRKLFPDKP